MTTAHATGGEALDLDTVTRFVYREARLADTHDYDAWEALWTDDAVYWVPAGADDIDPDTHVSVMYDNRRRIASKPTQRNSMSNRGLQFSHLFHRGRCCFVERSNRVVNKLNLNRTHFFRNRFDKTILLKETTSHAIELFFQRFGIFPRSRDCN